MYTDMMRVGIYARVSTHDQQTLPLQLKAMRQYVKQRKWKLVEEVEEVGSGANQRPKREELMKSARRREVDAIVVWKLDRWGRSLPDLIGSLAELRDLGIAFVSLTEALDFTTPAGRAMIALLSIFAEFERDMIRERVRAGIAQARAEGKPHGRPRTAATKAVEVRRLYKNGWNKSRIAREMGISRGSVIGILK
jgi:DNA invertase Pin-like site-specific DNA recombinase